jgi:subtilisin family serine protease
VAQTRLLGSQYELERPLVPELGIYRLRLKGSLTVREALRSWRSTRVSGIRYAQPDHRITFRSLTPNDPLFETQWSLHNGGGGADIHATEAWEILAGLQGRDPGANVVAVVDGGVDGEHEDLRENLWTNAGEIPGNGVDDDQDGYVDDVHGWDAVTSTGQVQVDYHGTHVAGIVAARGDNQRQTAGVLWKGKVLPVSIGSTDTSQVMEAYGFVLAQKKLWNESHGARGVNVVATNSSFGVDMADCKAEEFPLWNDIYTEMGKQGILSAAAAPNLDLDVDAEGDVPSGCDSPYLVTVTNTTDADERFEFAGYGRTAIDLGAPGTDIVSLVPDNQVDLLTGTSMATPHVAAAVAFLHTVASPELLELYAQKPAEGAAELKRILLASVDPVESMRERTTSGGRLNLLRAGVAAAAWKPAPSPEPQPEPQPSPEPSPEPSVIPGSNPFSDPPFRPVPAPTGT